MVRALWGGSRGDDQDRGSRSMLDRDVLHALGVSGCLRSVTRQGASTFETRTQPDGMEEEDGLLEDTAHTLLRCQCTPGIAITLVFHNGK